MIKVCNYGRLQCIHINYCGELWQFWWSDAVRCDGIESLCLGVLILLHFAFDDHNVESIDSIY